MGNIVTPTLCRQQSLHLLTFDVGIQTESILIDMETQTDSLTQVCFFVRKPTPVLLYSYF